MQKQKVEDLIVSMETALDKIMLKNGIPPDMKDALFVIMLKGMLVSLVPSED